MGGWSRRTRGFSTIASVFAALPLLLPAPNYAETATAAGPGAATPARADTNQAVTPYAPPTARADSIQPVTPGTPPSRAESAPTVTLSTPLPAAPVEEVVVSAPEPRYVAPTTRDRIGRIWAPVLINGQGPYRLVLDTGASRSAITARVAERLGVPITPDAVQLRGVTGTSIVAAVKVDRLEFGDLLVEGTRLPIVADAFGGAEGVLGGEGLGDKRIAIEFHKDRISIARSRRQPPRVGYSVVPFKLGRERGMRVEALVGRVKTVAVIDTGAQVTVGNLALRRALARNRGHEDQFEDAIIGVTEDIQKATKVRIPGIVAGELIVRNAEIMFSDLHIFDHWKLSSEPALMIGMDVLGSLDTLVIDYRRNELQIKTHD
jgi:predicted aspartyl protease